MPAKEVSEGPARHNDRDVGWYGSLQVGYRCAMLSGPSGHTPRPRSAPRTYPNPTPGRARSRGHFPRLFGLRHDDRRTVLAASALLEKDEAAVTFIRRRKPADEIAEVLGRHSSTPFPGDVPGGERVRRVFDGAGHGQTHADERGSVRPVDGLPQKREPARDRARNAGDELRPRDEIRHRQIRQRHGAENDDPLPCHRSHGADLRTPARHRR